MTKNAHAAVFRGPVFAGRQVPGWLVVFLCAAVPFFCCGRIAEELWNRGFGWDGPLLQTALLGALWAVMAVATRCRWLRAAFRVRGHRLIGLGALASGAIAILGYTSSNLAHDNLRAVLRGELYRSGQMSPGALAHCVRAYGIKSIVNLRGSNPDQPWYQAEAMTAAQLGVPLQDFGISSSEELELGRMDQLAELLRQAPKPVLIHCNGGADRSALASAIYLVAVKGEKPEAADDELSLLNGHLPALRPGVKAMDQSFWRYVECRLE